MRGTRIKGDFEGGKEMDRIRFASTCAGEKHRPDQAGQHLVVPHVPLWGGNATLNTSIGYPSGLKLSVY